MSEQPRDWDREMAEIDRAMAKQGQLPASAPVPAAAPSGRAGAPAVRVPARRSTVALTWFWVLLAVALAVALPLWPYQRACGLQLFFYLGAVGVTALIGLLGALASWANHRGLAHVLSLAVMLWAGAVALREVLPRVGYAKSSLAWMCTTEPAAPAARPASSAPAVVPATPAPEQSAPTQNAPTQSAPTQSAPAQSAPEQSAPAQSAPAP
ncbi:MAG TPA: hypothetical protein VMY76_13400 [Gemmatimonadales bacterium]|nr:hypothetical protein [Gemmatimonadales bacterium]